MFFEWQKVGYCTPLQLVNGKVMLQCLLMVLHIFVANIAHHEVSGSNIKYEE